MNRLSTSRLLRAVALLAGVLPASVVASSGLSANAQAQAGTQYVITNDDAAFPFASGVSFYSVGASGIVFQQQVQTGGVGIAGGYFGMNRIAVLDTAGQQCVYASDAGSGDIVGIAVSSLTVACWRQRIEHRRRYVQRHRPGAQ